MYDSDIHSVRSGNYHTLTLTTPVAQSKEPTDYNLLYNKPSINGVVLMGDLLFEDLGLPSNIADVPTAPLSSIDIEELITE